MGKQKKIWIHKDCSGPLTTYTKKYRPKFAVVCVSMTQIGEKLECQQCYSVLSWNEVRLPTEEERREGERFLMPQVESHHGWR